MRAIIFILILAIVALLIAIATNFLDIRQTRSAEAPRVSVQEGGVAAEGGQTPAFDVETGSVSVGTRPAEVRVPKVKVNPPDQAGGSAANTTSNAATNTN